MQLTMFGGHEKFIIDKPIRLIELFAGYGSQALALKYLGVNFEHWKICEWAVKSIQAYKDIHFENDNIDYSKNLTQYQIIEFLTQKGISANYNEPMSEQQIKRLGEQKQRQIYNNIQATHNLVNIQQAKGSDFDIVDTDKYCYIMTYSFPCQDLSSAGKGAGMAKGSNTRSGMLWEVERILDECDNLPQVLLMENVPEVIETKNIKHFASWLEKLESLGYKCYWQILNGKDYGVPQNRERCFMVSILGDYLYEFPEKIKLEHKLNDLLEKNVDEKYYLTDKQLVYAFDCNRVCDNTKRGDLADRKVNPSIAKTISCRGAESQRADITNFVIDDNEKEYTLGETREEINLKRQLFNKLIEKNALKENDIVMHNYTSRRLNDLKMNKPVVKFNNISSTLDTSCGDCIGVVHNHRIRKLTAKECFRLMGVKDEDFENVAKNQSNASLYHLAGRLDLHNCTYGYIFKIIRN